MLNAPMRGTDRDALLDIESSTIMFKPLDFSLELDYRTPSTEIENKLYDKDLMPLINMDTLKGQLTKIDNQLRLVPLLRSIKDIEAEKNFLQLVKLKKN